LLDDRERGWWGEGRGVRDSGGEPEDVEKLEVLE